MPVTVVVSAPIPAAKQAFVEGLTADIKPNKTATLSDNVYIVVHLINTPFFFANVAQELVCDFQIDDSETLQRLSILEDAFKSKLPQQLSNWARIIVKGNRVRMYLQNGIPPAYEMDGERTNVGMELMNDRKATGVVGVIKQLGEDGVRIHLCGTRLNPQRFERPWVTETPLPVPDAIDITTLI